MPLESLNHRAEIRFEKIDRSMLERDTYKGDGEKIGC
jgi:hypothetical protein